MTQQRYTLSLPEAIYEEIRLKSDKHNTSIREVVRQCLKLGLIAMEISENPDKALIIREKQKHQNGSNDPIFEDTKLEFIW